MYLGIVFSICLGILFDISVDSIFSPVFSGAIVGISVAYFGVMSVLFRLKTDKDCSMEKK